MKSKITPAEWVKRLHRHLDHVIANREPDLTGITIPRLIEMKFRQSIKQHGETHQVVARDCGVCSKTYYRYHKRFLPIVNMTNSDDCNNNYIAKASDDGTVSMKEL